MTQHYSMEEMLTRAINAGADMLCLSNNGRVYDADIVPSTIELVARLVAEGAIDRRRIAESAQRIRNLKLSAFATPEDSIRP